MIFIELIFNDKIFKSYDNNYYVSNDGDIYSVYKKGLLKHNNDIYGYHRVDIHSKHMKVHRLVYLVWCGDIPTSMQINHIDDNKDNNYYKNLYIGTQQENICDCKRNSHRVGNVKSITVLDKLIGKQINFPSVKDFIIYSGHGNKSGSLNKCASKKWFKERYEIIERKSVETIESYNTLINNYKY